MKKPRILIISDFYLPGFKSGGGMRTVVNTVEQLSDSFDFHIITRDHDGFGDQTPYPEIRYGSWNNVATSKVRYLAKSEIRPSTLIEIVRGEDWDAIYLNSVYSTLSLFYFVIRFLGLVNHHIVGVAPCGEVSDGAISNKRLKKTVFLWFSRLIGLHRDVLWRASNACEEKEIRVRLNGDSVMVVPDLTFPLKGVPTERRAKSPGILRLVFWSRVVPKKNLGFLISLLGNVEGSVSLTIIGPFESPRYEKNLRDQVERLPSDKHVEFKGPLTHSELVKIIPDHDFFVLPSLGENFGHVVTEALSASCPVIVSNQTNWNAIEERSAGYVLPLETAEVWINKMNELVLMDEERHAILRAGAKQFADEIFKSSKELELARNYFNVICAE
jgi:glycosyltransferase involved in cell wall biosynthesis